MLGRYTVRLSFKYFNAFGYLPDGKKYENQNITLLSLFLFGVKHSFLNLVKYSEARRYYNII